MVWHDLAREQDGVIAHAQLRRAGITSGHLPNLVERGLLRPTQYGLYLAGGAPLTYRARLWCAVLGTRGVLAFHTAAELWGMADRPDDDIHVLLPHTRRVLSVPGVDLTDRPGYVANAILQAAA